MFNVCGTCGKPEDFPNNPESELRPYGPNGSFICYGCAFSRPEMKKTVEANFEIILEASLAATGIFVIGAPIPEEQ